MTERPSATLRQIFKDLAERIDAGGVDSLTAADAMGRLSMELAELARPDPWGPHWHSVIALGMDGPRFRAMPSTPILNRAAACRMLARRIRAMHRECEERHCHTCDFVALLEEDDLYEGEEGGEEKALRMLQGPELLAAVYPCEGHETDNCLIICQLFAALLKEQWDAEMAPMPGNYL